MDFNFYMPASVRAEKGAVKNGKDIFSSYGKKCLIVTGGNSAKLCGALDDVTSILKNAEIEYEIFDKISANPKVLVCFDGGKKARENGDDFIIGIGGGSALDSAKAIAFYAANPQIDAEGIYSYKENAAPLPLILIGTTAGTGSEVTGVSVLTRANGQKKSVSGKNFYADVSFADPQYTYCMPFSVTVTTALDAFSHAAEGYFASTMDTVAMMFAEKSLPALWNALKFMYETKKLPCEKMRDEIYYASIFAGMELNICKAGFPHTMGYALTEDLNLPHGRACTAFLPEYIKRGVEASSEKGKAFFELIGTDFNELSQVISTLTDADYIKMSSEQIKNYCARWDNNANFLRSPGGFTKDDAEKLLTKLFLK